MDSYFLILFFCCLINFICGAIFGKLYQSLKSNIAKENLEKFFYFRGFEDGIYYTIDEYKPELFKKEMAENSYKEFKAILHGERKH